MKQQYSTKKGIVEEEFQKLQLNTGKIVEEEGGIESSKHRITYNKTKTIIIYIPKH